LSKVSIVTSVVSVPVGLLPVGNGIVGGSSGIIVVSFSTLSILDIYLGMFTVSSLGAPVAGSVVTNVWVRAGISIVAPYIFDVNWAVSVLILNGGCSFEAKAGYFPLLLIRAGVLPIIPLLYLNSSPNAFKSLNGSDTCGGKGSFSKLADVIVIVEPSKSGRGRPLTLVCIIDWLIGVKTVLALTISWYSAVGFL